MRTSTYAKTVQATLSRVGIHQNFNLSKTDYQITLLIKLQNFKKMENKHESLEYRCCPKDCDAAEEDT